MASLADGSALCGIGSTSVSREQEVSSGSRMGRGETLRKAEDGFLGTEEAVKRVWVEITGVGRAGAERPWP